MLQNRKNHENIRNLDESEIKIVRELIRDPRVSDNQIARKTRIPVMTVNRKRKNLERENLIRYYTSLDKGEFGLPIFRAKQLYIIKFKIGITMKKYTEVMEADSKWRMFNSRCISLAYLGEKDGHLALIISLDAKEESLLIEEFNGNIIPFLCEKLGKEAIEEVTTASLNRMIRVHHNYMPHLNMENGRIKDNWPDDLIFVNETSNNTSNNHQKLETFL